MHTTRLFHYGILVALVSACSKTPDTRALPPSFVGSEACAACHESEFAAWQGSHHELAMQPATDETVLGDFDDLRFDYFDETFEFSRKDGQFNVSALSADGEPQSWPVSYTFGIEPLQQYLVEAANGRKQALPVAWDTRPAADGGQRWFHLYPDEHVGPGDPLHWTGPYQNWNFMCAECHSTNLVMGYDFETDTFDTTYSEVSVGCEACHGPGSLHVIQAEQDEFDDTRGLESTLDDHAQATWTFESGSGIATRTPPPALPTNQAEACGRCHARRGQLAPHYEYGSRLADNYSIALLDEGIYFADGQILEEVYVYGSFLQSRMYHAGVTCSDCHDPHSAGLRVESDPSDVCSRCHLPSEFAGPGHSGHDPSDAACVDCHMASRTYMGIDDRRDHSFRIPRPDLHASIDVPLACDNCHEKDVLAATGEQRSRPHFGQVLSEARQHPDNELIVAALADAGIPAIARATLLTLLAPPFGRNELEAVQAAMEHEDPLVRTGALRALRNAAPATRMGFSGAGLTDAFRSVRLEAARTYADVRDLLPVNAARAFSIAADELRSSLLLAGSMPDALANLAAFESMTGNDVGAVRYLRRAVDTTPAIGSLQHALGLALVREGKHDEALLHFQRAHELEPANRRFVYVYAVGLNSMGRPVEAIDLLTAAHALHPGDFSIGWGLATMLRDAGEIDAALGVTATLSRAHPGNTELRMLREALESAKAGRHKRF